MKARKSAKKVFNIIPLITVLVLLAFLLVGILALNKRQQTAGKAAWGRKPTPTGLPGGVCMPGTTRSCTTSTGQVGSQMCYKYSSQGEVLQQSGSGSVFWGPCRAFGTPSAWPTQRPRK